MFIRSVARTKTFSAASTGKQFILRNSAVSKRLFSDKSTGGPATSNNRTLILSATAAVVGVLSSVALYYSKDSAITNDAAQSTPSSHQELYHATTTSKSFEDYQKIYNTIAKKIQDEDEYDGGIGYGPSLVRLAWHSSGTYDKSDHSDTKGGNFGGTIYHQYESKDDGNKGLDKPRKFLDSVHQQFPWLSRGDLVTLAGVTAIQEMQGPKIAWRPGRVNLSEKYQPPHGRLPDASQGATHVREVFHRMSDNFNDEEIAALVGVGHAIGRCHAENLQYDGPWTFSPNIVSNQFFTLLINEDWHVKDWDGPTQMEDVKTKSLMMLPADFAFRFDPAFLKIGKVYAEDQDKLFKVFAPTFAKLLELGMEFPSGQKQFKFKTLDEQEE